MDRGVSEIGDKVICLYRKGNHREGRIHLGIGVITHMDVSDSGPYYYSVRLDRDDKTINLINSRPYGVVVPYSKELDEKMGDFHNYHLRLILAIEDDYFEKLGGKQ